MSLICSSVNIGLPKSSEFKSQIGSDAIDDSLSTTNGAALRRLQRTPLVLIQDFQPGITCQHPRNWGELQWHWSDPASPQRCRTAHFFSSWHFSLRTMVSSCLEIPKSAGLQSRFVISPGKIASLGQHARCRYPEFRVKPYDSVTPRTCGLASLRFASTTPQPESA